LVKAVDGLSFSVEKGRTLSIVGESGSGKSVTSLGILGLHNRRNARMSGEIWVDGKELVSADPEDVRAMRGDVMAMIFQDPLSAMHPYYRIGTQIAEAYRVHNHVSKATARNRAIELLDLVGIPEPAQRIDSYPHQFSGGMRQRAMIAMALSCNPSLLIADEPTTALDVTVQAQILDLMKDLQKEFNSAIILITHDLGVVAEVATDVLVMYAGQAVEYGGVNDVFYQPEHPYTWGLLGSVTRLDRHRVERLQPIPGNPPSLINVPPGCPFHPRCAFGELNGGKEREVRPALAETTPGHLVACHLPIERRREIFATEVSAKL
jgi:peptide/nickel transport system ATP-binding protein